MKNLLKNLYDRDIIEDCTDKDNLSNYLESNKITLYCGFDPTADSLHVGSLMPLVTIRRFMEAGHNALIILGTTTAMIGDPSGKSAERVFISKEEIDKNCDGIEKQIRKILSSEKYPNQIQFLKNSSWLGDISLVDFLRTTGKHFSVNSMMNKDSVKTRLNEREQGISFTEFSYMLLQAHDFDYLLKNHNCRLQIGGSDQWGNITAGLDLIRKQGNIEESKDTQAFGLILPLLTRSDGKKLGKTEEGNIWLDKKKTSAYEFYQYWLNLPDLDALSLCSKLTEASNQELDDLKRSTELEPHLRNVQKYLAQQLTILCHSQEGLISAQKATDIFFGKPIDGVNSLELKEIFKDVPSSTIDSEVAENNIIDLLVNTKFMPSKSQARKIVESGGISINNNKVTDPKFSISKELFIDEELLIIKQGKKKHHLVILK